VLKVGCLGLCPKRGVSAISGARPDEVMVVPAGAEGASVLARMMVPARSPSGVKP